MTTRKKRPRSFKRLMLGDVIEIPLSGKRLAYAQYTHYHRDPPVFGHLIRVLPGLFRKRPDSFAELVQHQERFYAFFPAGPAVHRGWVRIVGHEEIPERCRPFPLFKHTNVIARPLRPQYWERLWDGKRDIPIDELRPDQYDLPILQIIPFDVLVERIESGWSPRDEVLIDQPTDSGQ